MSKDTNFTINDLNHCMKIFQIIWIFDNCFSINSTITCKHLNCRFPHRLDILKSSLPLANYLAEIKTWFITPPVTRRDGRSWIIRNTIINNRWICIYGFLVLSLFCIQCSFYKMDQKSYRNSREYFHKQVKEGWRLYDNHS